MNPGHQVRYYRDMHRSRTPKRSPLEHLAKLRLLSLVLSFAALSTGCEPSDAGHRCETSIQTYPLDQATSSGMTGQAFAAQAVGSFPVTLSMLPAPGAKVTLSPIPDGTQATLTIEAASSSFSHILSTYVPCKPGHACTDDLKMCFDQFSLPIRARLLAQNPPIDETWVGEMIAEDPADPDRAAMGHQPNSGQHAVRIRIERPTHSFQGALKVSEPTLRPGEHLLSHSLALTAQLKDGKLLNASVQSAMETETKGGGDGGSMSSGRVPLLTLSPAQ